MYLQTDAQEYNLYAYPDAKDIKIDGQLMEAIWEKAQTTTPFSMNYPNDSLLANSQTQVRILHNEHFIYIGAICHNAKGGDYVVQSLKRDFDFNINDAFAVYLDAFQDGNHGLGFAVNPYGVQWDAIISDGGHKRRSVITNWDGMWYAQAHRDPAGKYWSIEIAIPFRTLRYDHKKADWKINFARNDLQQNEISSWSPIARGFQVTTLSAMGKLHWEKPLPKSGLSSIINPYVAFGGVKDHEVAQDKAEAIFDMGLDAKVALNSSLNLDITINPDFSQVEVDQQVIDLQRFELFFPEKRPFFLENSDLFEKMGNSRIRPFFSRRIGSAGDDPVNILYGARLSGNIDEKWRIGLMNVHTASPHASTNHKNYTVASLQRNILNGSAITGFVTNRQVFNKWKPTGTYHRIAGLEFDYRAFASKLTGKSFFHYAFSSEDNSGAKAYTIKARYKEKNYSVFMGLDGVDKNYTSKMDYVPRLYHEDEVRDTIYQIGYVQLRTNGYYRFFFNNSKHFDFLSPKYNVDFIFDENYNYQEYSIEAGLELQFTNTSKIEFEFRKGAPFLQVPLLFNGFGTAFSEGRYNNQEYLLTYYTGRRGKVYLRSTFGFHHEYNGNHLDLEGDLGFRLNKHFNASMNFSQQRLYDYENEIKPVDFTLIGSKIEASFSSNLFFTTFIQYNTQKDNFNINARFNWRYQPLSDLHLVYTENYLATDFDTKNRALVLKLNYWIPL